MAAPFIIINVTANASGWSQLIVPSGGADTFIINNLNGPDDLLVTHDPASGLQTTVKVGYQWQLTTAPVARSWILGKILPSGSTAAYVKSTSASPRMVEATFL